MSLTFAGSNSPTLGAELEILLIDPVTRSYAPKVIEVLEQCETEGINRVKCELHLALVEVNTRKTSSFTEMAQRLEEKVQKLRAVTNKMNLELLMTGSHPLSMWHDNAIFPDPRYHKMIDKMQWAMRRINTNGMHLHFGVPDGDLALMLIYKSLPYVPHLIALTASSPYWQGNDTGFQSCRQNVMNSLIYCGLPPYFESWEKYSHYVAKLISTESIQTIKDLHWQIRPNITFGTVEWRVMDIPPTLKESLATLAFLQTIITHILRELEKSKPTYEELEESFWVARENQWEAAKLGFDGMIIKKGSNERVSVGEDIRNLMQKLTPLAKELGNYEDFMYLENIMEHGNSACRQREIFEKTGDFNLVIDALAWEFKHNCVITPERILQEETLSFLREKSQA